MRRFDILIGTFLIRQRCDTPQNVWASGRRQVSVFEGDAMEDDNCSAIASRDDFARWVGSWLPGLMPYDGAVFGIATQCTLGVRILESLAVDLPAQYLREVTEQAEVGCPVLSHWLLMRRPQYVEAGRHGAAAVLLSRFGLRNVLLHGYVDAQRAVATYFALFNVRRAAQETEADADARADYIAGRLHHAILAWHDATAVGAAHQHQRKPDPEAVSPLLTPAEQRVFRWLREGKTNWEIARILNKSEWTVKTQVQQILRKLNAQSRRDAVAVYRHGAASAEVLEPTREGTRDTMT
jgi:DNA-binding CsgD family transcriptional regulator